MNVRRPARLLAGGAICLAALAGAGPAAADAPDQQGWWTVTNPGGLPANPAAPDVPADGLLVQGGPQGATAFAALSYSLPGGGTPDKLTLKVAPSTATTPSAKVQLCPLKSSSFTPEQGGPSSDAPAYDCNAKTVDGTASSDGSSFTFTVAELVADGALNVAVLPGDATSRVVFSKPDASSLTTAAGGTGSNLNGTTTDGTTTSGTTGGSTTPSGGSAAPTGSGGAGPGPAAVALPAQPATTTSDPGQQPMVAASSAPTPGEGSASTPINAVPLAATSSSDSVMPRVAAGLVIVGALVGVLLWAFAGSGRSGAGWQPEA